MTRATRPRAVVFDLDGTLIDSLSLVLRSIAHALEPYGQVPPPDIFARLGGPPERFLPALLSDVRHAPAALLRMDTYHRENWHTIQPFAGVAVVLEQLRASDVQLAIWTGRDRASTMALLRDLKLEAFFATVVCGDDLASHKPDPEGLRTILQRLGVKPEEALYLGDADVDVLGGAGAGVDTVLIRHARTIDEDVRSKSWQSVLSPREAFDLVLQAVK